MKLPVEIQKARYHLHREYPYFTTALLALTPVEAPGIKTMAIDKWWRLYFDPDVVKRWSIDEIKAVLYHELSHLLRNHPERMKNYDPKIANVAADMEINDDIIKEGFKLPGNPILPSLFGFPEDLVAEEYAQMLLEKMKNKKKAGQGGSAQSASSPSSSNSSSKEGEAGSGQGKDSQPGKEGKESKEGVGKANSGSQGDTSGSKEGAPDGAKAGDSVGSKPGDSSGKSADSSASPSGASSKPGASSQPSRGPVSGGQPTGGSASGAEGREPGAWLPSQIKVDPTPAPGAGNCGSCATGHQAPWELPAPDKSDVPGISPAEAELIRRQVAQAIRQTLSSKNRGSVPGHWKRWAEEILQPKANWKQILSALVRHAVADTMGAADYSYRKPSRRQSAFPDVILPSLRRPVPEVAVVVDTSGSISDGELSQALGEVKGILEAVGLRKVKVLAVDSEVQAVSQVFNPRQIELKGGGGTDMRVGIKDALKTYPRPQVIVVLTDGYTPWPERPPHGVKVVVGLMKDGKVPEWAKTVKIKIEK